MNPTLETQGTQAPASIRQAIDPKRVPITWFGPILSRTGYGRASRETLLPLYEKGAAIAAQSIDRNERVVEEINADPRQAKAWSHMFARHPARGIGICFHTPKLWEGQDLYEHFRSRHPSLDAHIGYTMFETDRLPRGWARSIDAMDQVLAPSQFVRDVFVSEGISAEKVRIVPHGLDWTAFNAARPNFHIPDRAGFVFLSVFEWTDRKGWDILLDAWCDAFDARDDVMLLVRASLQNKKAPSVEKQINAHLARRGLTRRDIARIQLIDRFVPDAEMPALYASADAYVMPTRGEGWGIPFLEAMGSGLPTIGTRWSGHLDFMTDENSYLIDIDGLVPVSPEFSAQNPFYEPDHLWAQPKRRHTADLMREVFDHRQEAAAKGLRARDEVQRDWDNQRAADMLLDCAADYFESGLMQTMAAPVKTSVVLLGPLRERSGFAEEGRQYLMGFDELGIPVRSAPIATMDSGDHLDDETLAVLDRTSRYAVSEGFTALHHTLPRTTAKIPTAGRNIVRAMFETDSLPPNWAERYDEYDEIWVPSAFNVETFSRAGVSAEKLVIVPEALDRRRYEEPPQALELPGEGTFRFLSVFDWTLRKGWDLLLRAWAEAFRPGDPVTLLLKVHSSLGYSMSEIEAQMREHLAAYGHDLDAVADVILLDWRINESLMPSFYAATDCFVMPTRGEGWGRPFFEAMAAGTPVIGTRWSGQTEFMHEGNAWLLEPEVRRVNDREARETPVFFGHRWADVGIDDLIETMRRVTTDRQQREARAACARTEMLDHYDRRIVSQALADHLGIADPG